MDSFSLYGVKFSPIGARRVAHEMVGSINSGRRISVFTPNLQIIRSASREPQLRELLNSADILLPDGAGISLLCRINGLARVPRMTGIDTAHFLMRYAGMHGLSVFLLGAEKGVARLAAERLTAEISGLRVCGTHHGYFDKLQSSPENNAVLKKIRQASPDILFVCFGFPIQERWILDNLTELPSVKLCMGLGGSLDVWSGKVRRAPLALRMLDLEWLWRCASQPERFAKLL